jgi:hypothetical protein
MTPDTTRYKITLVVDTNVHPRKWIADVINDNLNEEEELVEWETEEVSDDFELLSSINNIPN